MTQNNFGLEGPYTKKRSKLEKIRRRALWLAILFNLVVWIIAGYAFEWFTWFR